MTNLTLTHLRFDAVAQTAVNLQGHLAGNNLRNALANVIRYATCPETHRREAPTPEHAATCPACCFASTTWAASLPASPAATSTK